MPDQWLPTQLTVIYFPGEPGLAGVYWSKGWWKRWWQLDYWSYKSCKAPVKSSPPTNQHPVFYRSDALPVAQPTVSKHWKENITFHGLAYPSSLGVFHLILLGKKGMCMWKTCTGLHLKVRWPESNPQTIDCKSNAITSRPPSHSER